MSARDPILSPVPLATLRPTQVTVGFREVARKRRDWEARDDGGAFLGRHLIPVIRGPHDRLYMLDNHHMARALLEAGVEAVLTREVADLSHLSKPEFWTFCDNRAWCHPYDADGERAAFGHIPKSLADMPDDPFRSLAAELRRRGGFAKEVTPYSEFTWADFLRRRMKAGLLDDDFEAAAAKALDLAHGHEAAHLPGWCGPEG